jgi:nitrous oxide reductase
MSLKMEYTGDDGRKYASLAEMMQAEADKVIAEQLAAIERAITAQSCPVHGGSASVVVTRTGDQVSYKIDACCEELAERAQEAGAAAAS